MEWWEYLIVLVVWVFIVGGFWLQQSAVDGIPPYEDQTFLKVINKLLIVCLLFLLLITYKLFLA